MARPEYVKCVSLPEGLGGGTWCGRTPDKSDWRFVDVEHAALCRLQKGRQLVCRGCKSVIVKALESEE
jgi:hypothetical protein